MNRVKILEMHPTLLPRIYILFLTCLSLVPQSNFGQARPVFDLDVARCWSYPMPEPGIRLAVDSSRVFLGVFGAKIDALSVDGKKVWSSELGGDLTSNILALDSGLFMVTSTTFADPQKPRGSLLRNLSKETGITNWIMRLPDADRHFLGGYNGSIVVVSKSGVIQSIDTRNGAVRWKREIADGFAAEPVFTINKVLVASSVKQIFTVLLSTGEIEAMRKVPHAVTSLAESLAGEVFVGDERGSVASLIGNDRPVWKFKSGGEISKIFATDGQVVATSHDNFIYSLNSRNGDLNWKIRLAGRVLTIGNILDRYALVTSFDEHGAAVADLVSGKLAGQIVLEEDELPIIDPISFNGQMLVLTNKAAHVYSLNGCLANKDGGPGTSRRPPYLK